VRFIETDEGFVEMRKTRCEVSKVVGSRYEVRGYEVKRRYCVSALQPQT